MFPLLSISPSHDSLETFFFKFRILFCRFKWFYCIEYIKYYKGILVWGNLFIAPTKIGCKSMP